MYCAVKAERSWPTIASLRKGLEDARAHADKASVTPGLLLDEGDLLPLIEAIEKRESKLRRLEALAKTTRDAAALVKAILEP